MPFRRRVLHLKLEPKHCITQCALNRRNSLDIQSVYIQNDLTTVDSRKAVINGIIIQQMNIQPFGDHNNTSRTVQRTKLIRYLP